MSIYEAVNTISVQSNSLKENLVSLRAMWISNYSQLTAGEKIILGEYILKARLKLEETGL